MTAERRQFILGVCSFQPSGIGALDWEQAQVKRAMIASAAEVVAAAPYRAEGITVVQV